MHYKTIIVILVIIFIGGVGFLYWRTVGNTIETPAPATAQPGGDKIVVDSPKAGEVVSSPIAITGKARGNWYFEGSFPIELQATDGAVIATAVAAAEGDWMTAEFVPFSVTMVFSGVTAKDLVLVLKKDNPSGLPEHDDSVKIPLKLK